MDKKVRKTRDQRMVTSLEMAKRNLRRRPNSIWVKRIDNERRVWLRKTADLLPARLVNFLFTEVLFRLCKKHEVCNVKYGTAIHYINEYMRHLPSETWETLNASFFDQKLSKALYRAIWLEAKALYNSGVSDEEMYEYCASTNTVDNSLNIADRFK